MEEPSLHPACAPIGFLVGSWAGHGRGIYPTIADFAYREEARFWHDGRPFLFYEQKTWRSETGAPSHAEVGFWRPQPDGGIEILLAHTNGIVEIQTGKIDGTEITTESKSLAGTPTAKTVAGLSRTYSVTDGTLTYLMNMAFGEHELQQHLEARLDRTA